MTYWTGITLKYFIFGLLTTLVGAWLFIDHMDVSASEIFYPIFFGFMTITGVFLTLSIQGVQFDPQNNRVKKFYYINFLKVGAYEKFAEDATLVLALSSSDIKGMKSWRSHAGSSGTKTYFIYIKQPDGSKIDLNEFTDQKKAAEELKTLSKLTCLPFEDKVQQAQIASMKRRGKRK